MKNRTLYLRRWLLALDRYELILRVKIARQRNRFLKLAAQSYEEHGEIANHIRSQHEATVGELLYTHFEQVIPYFGKLANKEVKAKHHILERKATDTFFVNLLEWARTRALNNASTIADTDLADVRTAIENGLAAGLGTAEIARGVRKVSTITPFRAATVARTETHAAATYGAIEEARQSEEEIGIKLVKRWLPTNDNRTRPAHRDMNYAPAIPLDEKFEVGGEYLDRPGDPAGSPENVINCRCALLTEEAPDE